ncbi:MAG: nucleotidyltransferase family protein [Pseudomonadota bacterium]
MTKPGSRREQFELLAALVTGAGPSRDADWGSEHLWQQLVPLAEMHRVTAALPAGLRRLGVTDQAPSQLTEFLTTLHALNTERNQALRRQCRELVDLLQGAEIRVLPLKGMAYELMGLYAEDPGGRMTIDIDLLVPGQDASRAQGTLISAGYRPLADYEVSRDYHHNYPRLISGPGSDAPGSIEVHFRMGRQATDKVLPSHRVLSGANRMTVDGDRMEIPNTLDLLDHAVMHSAVGHVHAARRTLRLRDVCDIYRLWQRAKSEGAHITDLRCMQHTTAARYFGACVLLHGERPDVLGALETPSKSFLRQILARQNILERVALETALVINGALLFQNPSRFVSKIFRRTFYRAALSVAKSRPV